MQVGDWFQKRALTLIEEINARFFRKTRHTSTKPILSKLQSCFMAPTNGHTVSVPMANGAGSAVVGKISQPWCKALGKQL
jgi:hypothetical protein